jgi:nicotinate-nucleotide adenylyltransferase
MRAAIFGGTFDPIHSAHITVAREAADAFALERVLFIPAANPPHKEATTAYKDRYAMVERACRKDPRFIASRIEEGQEKNYSFYTIQRVRAAEGPDARLFFVIGADAFAEIGSWHRSNEVIDAVEFIVVTRPGHDYASPPYSRVHRLETVALPVSSSEIRQKLERGEKPEEVPECVLRYIREHGLYGATAPGFKNPTGT